MRTLSIKAATHKATHAVAKANMKYTATLKKYMQQQKQIKHTAAHKKQKAAAKRKKALGLKRFVKSMTTHMKCQELDIKHCLNHAAHKCYRLFLVIV